MAVHDSKLSISALPSLRDDSFVKVIVGGEEATFYVYRNVICNSSMFFKAALNGTFKEAAEGKVLLPEDDPETFERFLQWIYTKAYNIFPPTSGFSETLWEYVRLYLFAEKAQVEPLKDQVIRQLFTFFGQWPLNQLLPYECVEFAYDHTLPESQLRRVLVARYTWLDAKIESKAITAIPEFAGDVAAALQQRIHNRNSSSPFNESFDSFVSNIKKSK